MACSPIVACAEATHTVRSLRHALSRLPGRKNPYAARLKRSVTIRLDTLTVDYFKSLAADTGMSMAGRTCSLRALPGRHLDDAFLGADIAVCLGGRCSLENFDTRNLIRPQLVQ